MIDINSPTFWIVGIVWFTVPILSWLWSWASLYFFRRAVAILSEATKLLETTKNLNQETVAFRMESVEIRTKAENDLKQVCDYYNKVADLLKKE